ncbi:MAG: response regulator, partial [Candidatus Lokiarchaeota archaeon]|nr:response regulator [Candidatus Lokiarchaeota archaeon]
NILIVEDDHSLRLLYEKALSLNGYNVIGSAKDGEEAVKLYKDFKNKPDIILMDHRMPIKNGIEASKEILANSTENRPKIIFASADKTIKEIALSIGAFSFKDKPFSLEGLFKNIEKALNMEYSNLSH